MSVKMIILVNKTASTLRAVIIANVFLGTSFKRTTDRVLVCVLFLDFKTFTEINLKSNKTKIIIVKI